MRTSRLSGVMLALTAALATACGSGGDGEDSDAPWANFETRTSDLVVSPDGEFTDLQQALDVVAPGARIVVRAGIYPSDIETVRPGPVTIVGEPGAVLDGDDHERAGPRIVHDRYALQGLEIVDTDEGLRVERAVGVMLRDMHIHDVNNECVRIRYESEVLIEDILIHDCGLDGNGEGVYVGLAPEQQEKFDGRSDASFARITRLRAYSVSEGVDVKEHSRAVVTDSEVWRAWDEKSGAISFRSDRSEARNNYLHDNAGAGIRIGGDERGTNDDSECDGEDCWGVNNLLRDNRATDNRGAGYRFMWGPQDADCSNLGEENGEGRFYYSSEVEWRVTCAARGS